MAEVKLFSFFIITYKRFDGVIDTLESLFQQDYPRIELIISDDGSSNYYDEIGSIKEFIDLHKSDNIEEIIYSHLEKNQGTVKNINNAIRVSHGDYLKGLGGGDVLAEKDSITKYVEYLESNDCKIVFGKMMGIRPTGEKVKHLASSEEDYEMLSALSPEQLCNRLYKRNCLPAPAWCAKKSLFIENGLFIEDANLIEDYPYWLKLCRNGERIGFMDRVQILYKLDGVSSAGSYGELFMKDMFIIYEKHIFPYDKRFGIFQPFYNRLKRLGLEAYMEKARWASYNNREKFKAYLKYGLFFAYINWENKKTERKNQGDK